MLNYKGTNFQSIDSMEVYAFQEMSVLLNKHLENIKKQYDDAEGKQSDMKKFGDKSKIPKIPKTPTFNVPKFK